MLPSTSGRDEVLGGFVFFRSFIPQFFLHLLHQPHKASSSRPHVTLFPFLSANLFFLFFIVGMVGILSQEIRKERDLLELRSYADDKPLNANKL